MPVYKYPSPLTGYDTSKIDAIKALLAGPALGWMSEENDKLLSDLQANILKHHNKKHSEYHFIQFKEGEAPAVKEWLTRFAEKITSAKTQLVKGSRDKSPVISIGLTYAGYRYLGIPDSVIPDSHAFRMGLTNRVRLDQNKVETQLAGIPQVHVIILYACDELPGKKANIQLDLHQKQLMGDLNKFGKRFYLSVGTKENPLHEDYHFEEGISNPVFFPDASLGKDRKAYKKTDVAPLDLVLILDKGGNQKFSCGSFGAFMKLRINDKAIKTLESEIKTKAQAGSMNAGSDFIRAALVGRFTDGTPFSLSDTPRANPTNHFDYNEVIRLKNARAAETDEEGARCPFYAHIRKANPRTPETRSVRIARRGVFYNEDGKEKGLLFLSFQRSLEDQFEVILNNWMLNRYTHLLDKDKKGEPKNVDAGKDILFSTAGDTYQFSTAWNEHQNARQAKSFKITVPETIVDFLGGIYFFTPSISFFRKLAPAKTNRAAASPPGSMPFLPGTEIFLKQDQNPGDMPHQRAPESPAMLYFIAGTEVQLQPSEK